MLEFNKTCVGFRYILYDSLESQVPKLPQACSCHVHRLLTILENGRGRGMKRKEMLDHQWRERVTLVQGVFSQTTKQKMFLKEIIKFEYYYYFSKI